MAEFVGTALLVYMSCGASVSASILFPGMTPARIMCEALATGGAYIFLMYSITTISGGLLNPAVTFALAITGKVGIITAFFYFVAQVVGGVVGAGLLR
jgi:glycerol uptake facilitator-like aquaporin